MKASPFRTGTERFKYFKRKFLSMTINLLPSSIGDLMGLRKERSANFYICFSMRIPC